MLIILFLTVVVILYAVHKYLSRNYDYWRCLNVPFIKPDPIFGNFTKTFTLQETMAESFSKLYDSFNSPYFGVYVLDKPFLVIKDPELIKDVLIRDFDHFSDRNFISDDTIDSMSAYMLLFANNPEWKYMRNKITPVFSSTKMKHMFKLIKTAGDDMVTYLNRETAIDVVEVKQLCRKYAVNVITSCAFGLNGESFQREDAPFQKTAEMMCEPTLRNTFRQASYFFAPGLVKFFKLPFFDLKVSSFIRGIFWKVIEDREQSGETRNDIIDVIKHFKDQPHLSDDFVFEGDKILAQVAQFFGAGFESVSATISFALYELALHPEVQKKLRLEIKNTFVQYTDIDYECVQDMHYLSMVVDETLRKYPVLPFLNRKCVQDYKVPNSNLVIPKDTPIHITILGLHRDPQYYPNPLEFNPERFSRDSKHKIVPFTYLPFGEGPRNCIGANFGILTAKVGLIAILLNFEIEICSDTPEKITFSPKAFSLSSIVGIPLRLNKICN